MIQQDHVQFDTIVAYTASALRSGRSPESLRADLLKRQVSENVVDQIVDQARAMDYSRGLRAGVKYFAIGLVCLAIGALITGTTYTAATGRGGVYIITYGLFGFGVVYTFGGVVRLIVAAISRK